MPKHRAHRASTLRWSAHLGAFALLIGSAALLGTDSIASAHCRPAWSNCDHHTPNHPPTTVIPPTTPPTTTATLPTTATTTTSSAQIPVDPTPETIFTTTTSTSTTSTTTTVPGPTYTPPAYTPPAIPVPTTTGGGNSQQTATRPPGQLPTPRPKTPTTPDIPQDAPQDSGAAAAVPPAGGGPGGGTGDGSPVGTDSVPTAEPATSAPAVPEQPRTNPQSQTPPAVTEGPTIVAVAPSSAHCLLGTNDSGGCAGADTARDLAPAGLLVLGALALLGSGSFLESLRGSLRG